MTSMPLATPTRLRSFHCARIAVIKAFVMRPLTKREIARTIRQALDW
jgi:hypothetical protein